MDSHEASQFLDLATATEVTARLEIINSRLLAWALTGDAIWSPIPELFDMAGRRYQTIMGDTLDSIDNDMDSAITYVEEAPVMALLEAFEQSLNDLDVLLMEVDS
jgi:hypothetical protein